MDIDLATRPKGANIQRQPLICYKCRRPGHRQYEGPGNHIRLADIAEVEEENEEELGKDFPKANEE